jgi:hypothetical protein
MSLYLGRAVATLQVLIIWSLKWMLPSSQSQGTMRHRQPVTDDGMSQTANHLWSYHPANQWQRITWHGSTTLHFTQKYISTFFQSYFSSKCIIYTYSAVSLSFCLKVQAWIVPAGCWCGLSSETTLWEDALNVPGRVGELTCASYCHQPILDNQPLQSATSPTIYLSRLVWDNRFVLRFISLTHPCFYLSVVYYVHASQPIS